MSSRGQPEFCMRIFFKRLSFASLRPAGDHQARQQAAAGVGQQFEAPVVQAGDAVDDGEAEAGAGGVAARGVEPREGAFQAFGFRCRNAGALVADFDPDFVGLPRGADGDFAAAVFR